MYQKLGPFGRFVFSGSMMQGRQIRDPTGLSPGMWLGEKRRNEVQETLEDTVLEQQ